MMSVMSVLNALAVATWLLMDQTDVGNGLETGTPGFDANVTGTA